jgi:uncharacterized protein (TIGR02145 family)
MKRVLFLLIIFCALEANAQNYLISFTGSGASTTVNSIKVENLTKGTSLNLIGGDILRLTTATGVNSFEDKQSPELSIYPNPMTNNTTLKIYPPFAGDAIITVYEMTGRPVSQIKSYLDYGRQEFLFSGLNNGVYLIIVKGDGYQLSGKLLCNGKSNGPISFEKVSSNIQSVDEKKPTMTTKGIQATFDMAYSTGERLKFTGKSGIYSTVLTDVPATDKSINFIFIACTDGDNNNYSVVGIGTQVWMAENLRTTKLSDVPKTAISNITNNTAWTLLSTPAYSWFNNDIANKPLYGALYNWFAVNTLNLCPVGWHVPTDAEFGILETTLGMLPADIPLYGVYRGTTQLVGSKMKNATGWANGENGTNSSGFSALPGGYRYYVDGTFQALDSWSYWWSSDIGNGTETWYRRLDGTNNGVYRGSVNYKAGKYVRCLKN